MITHRTPLLLYNAASYYPLEGVCGYYLKAGTVLSISQVLFKGVTLYYKKMVLKCSSNSPKKFRSFFVGEGRRRNYTLFLLSNKNA